jgi:hypothetical protein
MKFGTHQGDTRKQIMIRLQQSAMTLMVFLVLLSFMMTNLQALLWQSSDWLVGAVLPGVVATLTNAERAKYAAAPLSRSATLDYAATLKAEHMAAEGYFAHNSPGGITPWYWFERAGYVYAHAGENLAVHFTDSEEVVRAWMNSPTHKANVVGPQYTEIGIGTAKGRYQGHDTVFVVQLFGTPAKRPVVVAPPTPTLAAVPSDSVTLPSATTSVVADEEVFTPSPRAPLAITTLREPVIEAFEESVPATEQVAGDMADDVRRDADEVTSDAVVTPGRATSHEIIEVVSTDDTMVSLYDSFTATSSGLMPYKEGSEFVAGTTAPMLVVLATQPRGVLQALYLFIGSIVLILLIASIVMGYRTHHVRTVLVGVGLLVLMSLLFMWHVAVTGGAVIG